jgi:hypothetical protein
MKGSVTFWDNLGKPIDTVRIYEELDAPLNLHKGDMIYLERKILDRTHMSSEPHPDDIPARRYIVIDAEIWFATYRNLEIGGEPDMTCFRQDIGLAEDPTNRAAFPREPKKEPEKQ